ncbi:MAG: CCA tRNA nucleotidyltransferase [Candidatus Omnitrophota bacterium]
MKQNLNKLAKQLRQLIRLAYNLAAEKGMHAYLVGGFVRDSILGVPNFDLDIIVEGNAPSFASLLAKRINAKVIIHPRFGTATLVTPKKIKVDIATVRSEIYPQPASLPVVHPGTIEDDLARRDFTINALAIELLPDGFGRLVDFYHGKHDIQSKIIRILHPLSFIDDPTRIIRAVRFEQRLKFKIELRSLKLLKAAQKSGMLKRVSPHRLRDELILILSEPLALNCIVRLNKLAGFDFIHPRIKITKATLNYLTAIKKEIDWFKGNLPKHRPLDVWLMYFTGILSVLKKSQVIEVCRKFGLRRGETKRIISYVKFSQAKVSRLSKKNILPSQIYQVLEPLSFEVILLIKAKYKNKLLNRLIFRFFKHYNGTRVYLAGRDLAKLGLKPSPDYKKILDRLLCLQLNRRINSRRDALKWVKQKAKGLK